MSSDALVRSLVADLKPVRRLGSVESRAARWAGLAVLCVGLGAVALGARPDLARKLHDSVYLAESAALLMLFVSAAWSAFRLSVPGAERGPLARILPVVGLVTWVILVASRWSPGDTLSGSGWSCVWRMAGLALAPTLAIVLMLRAAAPLARTWTGSLAVLSASALAILGTQAVCMKDDAGHLLLWHVAPVLLAAFVGRMSLRSCSRRSRAG